MKYFINSFKSVILTGIFLVIYHSIGIAQAIDVVDPGRAMAAQCSQCHGMEGNNYEGFDSLEGESYDKIYDELWKMFNSSKNELMDHQAKGYTEDDIMSLAKYFESQANVEGEGDEDPVQIESSTVSTSVETGKDEDEDEEDENDEDDED